MNHFNEYSYSFQKKFRNLTLYVTHQFSVMFSLIKENRFFNLLQFSVCCAITDLLNMGLLPENVIIHTYLEIITITRVILGR